MFKKKVGVFVMQIIIFVAVYCILINLYFGSINVFAISMEDAMASGKSLKCECPFPSGTGGSVYYIKGDKYRYELGNGLNMIYKDNILWQWMESTGQGFKTSFTKETMEKVEKFAESIEKSVEKIPGATQGNFSDCNCSSYPIDNSFFTPPADVEFITQEFSVPTR